jgi:hypothetical protein
MAKVTNTKRLADVTIDEARGSQIPARQHSAPGRSS